MRINVYGEEVTAETELVVKRVEDEKFGVRSFYGLRFYLKSPPELHDDPADDDRSAITIWCRWSRRDGHDFGTIHDLLDGLAGRLDEAWRDDWAYTVKRSSSSIGDDPNPPDAPPPPKPYKARA